MCICMLLCLYVSVNVCLCVIVFLCLSVCMSLYMHACIRMSMTFCWCVYGCLYVLCVSVCPCNYMSLCALVAVGSQAWVWFSISLAFEVGFLTSCAQASCSSRSHGSSCLYFPSCCEVTGSRGGHRNTICTQALKIQIQVLKLTGQAY